MKPQHIRTLGRIVGLVAVLGIASIAAGQPLSDQQITRQLVDRLAKNDAFQNVRVSVQEHIVSLTGTVPSLWAKTTAIAKARQTAALRSVMSGALTIESAESDRAIAEQIAQDMRRVSIPGPSAAARSGVSTAPGIAESNVPPGRFNRHGIDSGFGHGRFGDPFDHSWPHVGRDHFEHHTSDPDLHGPASFDFRHHLRGVGPHGFGIGGQGQLQSELHEAQYGHTGDSFYGIFDSVDGWIDGGVVALSGYVTHRYKADRVALLVSRVHGVREIQNQIEVLPRKVRLMGRGPVSAGRVSQVISGHAACATVPRSHVRWLGEPPPRRSDRVSPGGESGPPGAPGPSAASPDRRPTPSTRRARPETRTARLDAGRRHRHA